MPYDFAPSPCGRRRLLKMLGGIGTMIVAPAWPGLAWATDPLPLRVGVYKGMNEPLMKAAGLSATPYPVQYAEFTAGSLIAESLSAQALDLSYVSEVPMIFAAASQARLKAVAAIRGDVNNQVILVPKDSSIHSIADLKGKRVGYIRANSTQLYLYKMLKEASLKFSDINAINLSVPDGQTAFASGALDAWAVFGPTIQMTIERTGARVLKTALGYLSGNYLFVASDEALRNPVLHGEIGEYLVRIKEAYQWMNAHFNEWAPINAQATGIPLTAVLAIRGNESQPTVVTAIDAGVIASAQDAADTFFEAGMIPHKVDLAPMFDRSFIGTLSQST